MAAKEQTMEIGLVVNGQEITRSVNPKMSLMRFLRDDLELTGTKEGCTTGDCGTCVVLVDGEPVDSCLFLMRRAEGTRVETIEGLASPEGRLHPLQAAFIECGGVQCGFCTPGMLMAAKALLDEHPSPTEDQIRAGLKDVICRCTGYMQIFEALNRRPSGSPIRRSLLTGNLDPVLWGCRPPWWMGKRPSPVDWCTPMT